MDFLQWLSIMGGVCTVATATEHVSAKALRALRRSGALWTPLRGWVALEGVRNDATHALALGGFITCVSAFRVHGLWTPHGDQALHVRVHRRTNSARVNRTDGCGGGTSLHRLPWRVPERLPWDAVDDVLTALTAASTCVTDGDLLAAADSALREGRLQPGALRERADLLGGRRGHVLRGASHLSGSGSESLFAAALRRARIRFVQQAELLPGEFFDFLIGKSLVVEIDSLEWHSSREQMANDRRRDAQLTALGYRVIRFTYEQVMFQPEAVLHTVLELVRRDMHRRVLVGGISGPSTGQEAR